MGPGTHIGSRIIARQYPTSYTDTKALIHDIEYLISTNKDHGTYEADSTAINNTEFSLQGATMFVGLNLRRYFNLPYNTDKDRVHSRQKQDYGKKLKQFIQQDPEWNKLLKQYSLKFSSP
jgi:hypothetical protein